MLAETLQRKEPQFCSHLCSVSHRHKQTAGSDRPGVRAGVTGKKQTMMTDHADRWAQTVKKEKRNESRNNHTCEQSGSKKEKKRTDNVQSGSWDIEWLTERLMGESGTGVDVSSGFLTVVKWLKSHWNRQLLSPQRGWASGCCNTVTQQSLKCAPAVFPSWCWAGVTAAEGPPPMRVKYTECYNICLSDKSCLRVKTEHNTCKSPSCLFPIEHARNNGIQYVFPCWKP